LNFHSDVPQNGWLVPVLHGDSGREQEAGLVSVAQAVVSSGG
jgi:hypothetical protein